jgi:hypothetical protein
MTRLRTSDRPRKEEGCGRAPWRSREVRARIDSSTGNLRPSCCLRSRSLRSIPALACGLVTGAGNAGRGAWSPRYRCARAGWQDGNAVRDPQVVQRSCRDLGHEEQLVNWVLGLETIVGTECDGLHHLGTTSSICGSPSPETKARRRIRTSRSSIARRAR